MYVTLASNNYADLKLYDERKRDLLLICPGGGYEFTSKREAKPVAECFGNEGYHTAIYYYRESKLIYPDTMTEGKELLDILSNHPLVKRIIVFGFSAGGHLALSLAEKYPDIIKGTVLGYPVITTQIRFRHPGSFINLLGGDFSPSKLDEVSLEKHIPKKLGPIFLFHTMDDSVVPVENSMLLLGSLRMKRLQVEGHLFESGRHGVSLATAEVTFEDMTPYDFEHDYGHLHVWVELAKQWLKRL